ncbi:MAG: VIT domain-containing protein [Anaerolineae bacterium]
MKRIMSIVLVVLLFCVPSLSVLADGVIIPRPPIERPEPVPALAVKYHRVTVAIENQVAVTHIDQVFVNDSGLELEGDYIFPLPEGAAISQFVMWVDGKRLEAQVLNAAEARQIYEEIVASRRDPALLEYVGRNAFRARVYPIASYGEVRLEIEYSEVLASEGGLTKYVYPLNTEKFSAKPLEQVSISVVITSSEGLSTIYSPSHDISVNREGSSFAQVGYEEVDVTPDRDFELYFGADSKTLAANIISFKRGSADGYFLLLLTPPMEPATEQVIAKDVTLVLDTSGSMRGEKMDQAVQAAEYILNQLGPDDRFNIIRFSTDVQPFRENLVPVSDIDQAIVWLGNQAARGGTNIYRALETALAKPSTGRPHLLLFITDGLPTEGNIAPETIIDLVSKLADENTRLFAFGVGDDVNTYLLDTLTTNQHGTSVYVRPGQNIDTEVSGLYNKIGQPLLTDVTLDIQGAGIYDIYPYPLPDLYVGSQTSIVGRYSSGGLVTIRVTGKMNGRTVEYNFNQQPLFADQGQDLVPGIWATRKIGYLLTQIRLHGVEKELVDEIVDLSLRFGIITPYTSFLIDENEDVLSAEGREAAAQKLYAAAPANEAERTNGAQAVGAGAVDKSVVQDALRSADVAQSRAAQVKTIGDKTFILQGSTWIDTLYRTGRKTIDIRYGSARYLQLLDGSSDWNRYLALGPDVIVVQDGEAYHIGVYGDTEAHILIKPESAWLDLIITWITGLLGR